MESLIKILFLSTLIVGVYLIGLVFAILFIHNRYKETDKLTDEELYKILGND